MNREPRGWPALPAGLVVGLGLSFATILAVAVGGLVWRAAPISWWIVEAGGVVAGMTLAAIGCLELSRRVAVVRERKAQVAACAFGLHAAVGLSRVMIYYLDPNAAVSWAEQAALIQTASLVVATVALLLSGERPPLWAWAIAVLVPVAAAPPPQLDTFISDLWPRSHAVGYGMWTVVALLLMWRASDVASAEPAADTTPAITGLRRAALGLWIWLGGTALMLTVISIPVPAVQAAVAVIGTAIGAVALILFATGVVRIASSSGTSLPRYRFHVVAFLALWNAIGQAASVLYLYLMTFGPIEAAHRVYISSPALPRTMRVVTTVSIAILITAVGRMATTTGDDKLKSTASMTLLLFVMLMAGSFGLTELGRGAHPGDLRFYAISLGSTFTVGGLVLVASLCTKAAAALELRPALAPATLRSTASDPA